MKENIKNQAIIYLMKNPLLHMGMIEPIRRNTADILYAKNDGVLLKEQKSNAYMISVNSFEKGQVPFGQIEVNNKKSIALQNKLGFKISEDKLYWMF